MDAAGLRRTAVQRSGVLMARRAIVLSRRPAMCTEIRALGGSLSLARCGCDGGRVTTEGALDAPRDCCVRQDWLWALDTGRALLEVIGCVRFNDAVAQTVLVVESQCHLASSKFAQADKLRQCTCSTGAERDDDRSTRL